MINYKDKKEIDTSDKIEMSNKMPNSSRISPKSKNRKILKFNDENNVSHIRCQADDKNTEEDLLKLKHKLFVQNNTLKEYDSWVNLLINMINSREYPENHFDFGSNIQKRLEKIQNLELEKNELKTKYLKECQKNLQKIENINNLKYEIEIINYTDQTLLIQEINSLKESVNCLSDEVFLINISWMNLVKEINRWKS